MLNQNDIQNSALESIYWWNRTESYYHTYFSSLEDIAKDAGVFAFFVSKIFNTFLGEYSVRRNIAAGETSVHVFAKRLVDSGFYRQIVAGDLEAVDYFSEEYSKEYELTNGRQTHSLLSKIAFLINPIDFSLMDTYAKESLWQLIKGENVIRRKELNRYSGFIACVNQYIERHQALFLELEELLAKFKGTEAFEFFEVNPAAFRRRIFDKLLWIKIAKRNGRNIDNSAYKAFLSYVPSWSGVRSGAA
jgi:hypothetical protein